MRVPSQVIRERREKLAALLRTQSYMPLSRVCREFGVSEATARRDLVALERERRIVRTYGGALAEFNQQFESFQERRGKGVSGKLWIAREGVKRVKPGMTVYMDSGTTVYALAESLATTWEGGELTVVTNNLPVAQKLAQAGGVSVTLLGGQFLPRQSVLLGRRALESLRGWEFDVAFFGAEGVDAEGISNSTREIVELQRRVVELSVMPLLCVDRTKFGRRAPVAIFTWEDAPDMLTDARPSDFQRLGVDVRRIKVVCPVERLAGGGKVTTGRTTRS